MERQSLKFMHRWRTGRIAALVTVLFLSLFALLIGWWRLDPVQGQPQSSLQVASSSFANGASIPKRYTCDGGDISPNLQWPPAPPRTKSFAIIVNDPDAPVDFTHWLVFNIRPDTHSLVEGASTVGAMPPGASEGVNGFGVVGYAGPCPPPGNAHHYVFRVYALDATLPLADGARRGQVESAMRQHILAAGQLIGTYRRELR